MPPCWGSKWNHMLLKQFEKTANSGNNQQIVSSRASTRCPLTDQALGKAGAPPSHTSLQESTWTFCQGQGLSGIRGGSLSLLHPHPKNFTSFPFL